MNKAEGKVGRYVLDHADDLLQESVSEVARRSGVSDATVVRFCRTLGFRGFQDLKITLARDLVSPLEALQEDLSPGDDVATVVRKAFQANVQAILATLEVLDPRAVGRAVELLGRARRILLIGVGTSGPNVLDAYNKFFRLGLPCRCQIDSHLQVMEAALLSRGDVVLAISHSGSTKDPIETLKVARGRGAWTLCITHNAMAPITHYADVVLVTASPETRYRHEALASRIAQQSIINALFLALSLPRLKQVTALQKRIEDAIVVKQY